MIDGKAQTSRQSGFMMVNLGGLERRAGFCPDV